MPSSNADRECREEDMCQKESKDERKESEIKSLGDKECSSLFLFP